MLSSRVVLFFSALFLANSLNAKSSNSNDNNVLLKSGTATQQLVIIEPNSQTVLVANQTSTILIGTAQSKSLLKSGHNIADNTVATVSTFNCSGQLFNVESTLGVQTEYTVDPALNGDCSIVAAVPNNPGFTPSAPIVVVVATPIYYEGDLDSTLHTGQTINNYLRASNDAPIQATLNISCTNGAYYQQVYSTNTNNFYTLPAQLTGDCTFTTPVVPQDYLPIVPFTVTIEPTILFTKPTENQTYQAGTPVIAELTSSNGGNPTVEVTLICNGLSVATLTQLLNTQFKFGPSQKMFGNCVLSVETSASYYTESTVNIAISSTMTFKSPTNGQAVGTGADYVIELVAKSGNGLVPVTVTGQCQQGGSFTQIVTLGRPERVTMGQEFSGNCVLTASANAPNFSKATTNIVVYSSLTPEQSSTFAKNVALSGRIFSLTKPNPSIKDPSVPTRK